MALNRFMHPDNPYSKKGPPNFMDLATKYPDFAKFVTIDVANRAHIDFNNKDALHVLTTVLLLEDFGLTVALPRDRLIPAVPLRINYLLWIRDIFQPLGSSGLTGLDLGAGASCIYPLLGHKLFGWKFVALESDVENLKFCAQNVSANAYFDAISVVRCESEPSMDTLLNAVSAGWAKSFDFVICNPPFFDSTEDSPKNSRHGSRPPPAGVNTAAPMESQTPGGEVRFVSQMLIEPSLEIKEGIRVYSTMLGHRSSLAPLKAALRESGVTNIGQTEFCQGKTMRWGLAWSFDPTVSFPKSPLEVYRASRPHPLQLAVPLAQANSSITPFNVETVEAFVKQLFDQLGEIQVDMLRSTSNCRVLLFDASAPAWQHQRSKRRAAARAAANASEIDSQSNGAMDAQNPDQRSDLKRKRGANGHGNTDDWIHSEVAQQSNDGGESSDEDDDPQIKRLRVGLDDAASLATSNNSPHSPASNSVLKCYISIKLLPDKSIRLDLSYLSGENKDYIHQLYQFLKNKLINNLPQANQ